MWSDPCKLAGFVTGINSAHLKPDIWRNISSSFLKFKANKSLLVRWDKSYIFSRKALASSIFVFA